MNSTNLCATIPVDRPHEYDLGAHMAQVADKAKQVENHCSRVYGGQGAPEV
jgi:hypothetical protein